MAHLVQVGTNQWVNVLAVAACRQMGTELDLWTANGSGPIRVGDFTADKFLEQVPAYVFARFLKVSAGYYVNPEGICTAEEDGPVLRLGLRGGGSILVPSSMTRAIDSALQEVGGR